MEKLLSESFYGLKKGPFVKKKITETNTGKCQMSSTQAALPREVHVCLALLKLVLMCSAVGDMGGIGRYQRGCEPFPTLTTPALGSDRGRSVGVEMVGKWISMDFF